MSNKMISWFSAGVSSAVATKLMIDRIDEIIYTHIDDQHSDTMRFVKECEEWFGKPVTILQSPYKCVNNAACGVAYVNGPAGAACTRLLKRRVRQEWESKQTRKPQYVWGLDAQEFHRADRIMHAMHEFFHFFPLIDRHIGKAEAHEILKASGIKRPAMYDLGYSNNNCIGCVKGGMGYWNKIRVDFPEVFAMRCAMERKIGATCIKGIYLDELDPNAGRPEDMIMDDCGIMCEVMKL